MGPATSAPSACPGVAGGVDAASSILPNRYARERPTTPVRTLQCHAGQWWARGGFCLWPIPKSTRVGDAGLFWCR